MSSQPHLIVTGASGRIARSFSAFAKEHGCRVTGISRNPQGEDLSWEQFFANDYPTGADAVVHLAWSTVPFSSEQHPERSWIEDLPLLRRIGAQLSVAGSPRLVFLSSGAVYGNCGDQPSQEDDRLEPRSWYGHAKVAGETMIRELVRRGDLRASILRCSTAYGLETGGPQTQGAVSALARAVVEELPFSLWGGGTAVKDYLYIDDLSAAILAAVAIESDFNCFNVCSGETSDVLSLIKLAKELSGKSVQIEEQDGDSLVWDLQRNLLDGSKFHESSGWKARMTLRKGMEEALNAAGEPSST